MRIPINEALQATNAQPGLVVCGWVRTRRDAKGFTFLELNDGSCLANLQCIVEEAGPAGQNLAGVNTGAAVRIAGDLVESPGQGQKWELRARDMHIFGLSDSETFPLQKKRHSDEFLRTISHLRPRTNKYGAVFRIRSEAARAVHNFFHAQGFFHIHTPILTGSDCEGAGEMFRVTTLPSSGDKSAPPNAPFANDFFGREASLTVSGQMEAEALALALSRVYTFGPTFRAENSNTPRHAAEFWMIEPEAAWMDLTGDMTLGEDMVRAVTRHILSNCAADLTLFDKFVEPGLLRRLTELAEKDFVRLPYADAVDILSKSGRKFEFPVSFGIDLQTEHERFLTEEHFHSPVTVYNYPKEIKAFYMRQNDDGRTVAAMDLLVPKIGELIGGSQREERLAVLQDRIVELGQNPDDYWWYLDLRRFGSAPHAGFGLGFERLIMLLTGITNIRDVIPFPRTPGSLEF